MSNSLTFKILFFKDYPFLSLLSSLKSDSRVIPRIGTLGLFHNIMDPGHFSKAFHRSSQHSFRVDKLELMTVIPLCAWGVGRVKLHEYHTLVAFYCIFIVVADVFGESSGTCVFTSE